MKKDFRDFIYIIVAVLLYKKMGVRYAIILTY